MTRRLDYGPLKLPILGSPTTGTAIGMTSHPVVEYPGIGSGGGGASTPPLLTWTDGVFGRSSERWYVSADQQTVTRFAIDVMRTGARGVLIERESVTYVPPFDQFWSGANGAGVSWTAADLTGSGSAPDGSIPGIMAYGASNVSRLTRTIGAGIPDAQPLALSAWFLGATGATAVQPGIDPSVDGDTAISTSVWTRLVKIGVSKTAASDIVFFENRAAGTVQTVYAYGGSVIVGTYPLAPMRAVSTTYGPDSLTYLSAQVPLALREGAWSMDITPEWAPADLVSGDIRWILTFGASAQDGLRVRHDGSDVVIESVVGGSVVATSPALTGSAREVMRTIAVDAATAIISVDAVDGAAGTPWSWAGGVQVRVGGILGGSGSEFDGYLTEPVTV